MPGPNSTNHWNPTQYLKFKDERTRPVIDLLSHITLEEPKRIVDLGCGSGNSTAELAARYPNSHLTAMDLSPDMLERARAALPNIEFTLEDLNNYTHKEGESVDLFFSNSVFQWLSYTDRIVAIKRLMETQSSGGLFAFQVPDNIQEPSHEAMRKTVGAGPWAGTLAGRSLVRDEFQTPRAIYDALNPLCSSINIWHTYYHHVLDGHEAIVEWLKGTGLPPFIGSLSLREREGFLGAYLEQLKALYPRLYDGKVLLRFLRLFVIAVRA
jgi:trans-aconitate 2-methyltransferase